MVFFCHPKNLRVGYISTFDLVLNFTEL